MLQSLYSRSPRSVTDHLDKLKGSGPFMDRYYVGYGHRSIGDCGTTTLFIEGVSMLAAKAIQQNPLYSGQEASTRYMDFSAARCHIPHPEVAALQQDWFALYSEALPLLVEQLGEDYPLPEQADEKAWCNALKARAFDIARGLIPAGALTNLSWHTNLRQAWDHLQQLLASPLVEVQELAQQLLVTLQQRYPHSFGFEQSADDLDYRRRAAAAADYPSWLDKVKHGGVMLTHNVICLDDIPKHLRPLLKKRPRKVELHREFERCGSFEFSFPLDFGSYRDLQRHRNMVLDLPLLAPVRFHDWYPRRLPEDIAERAQQLLEVTAKRCADVDAYSTQYATPMGALVSCELRCSLPQAVYLAELRSGPTVHQTLRWVAQWIGEVLRHEIPGIKLYVNEDEETLDPRRGTQTITPK